MAGPGHTNATSSETTLTDDDIEVIREGAATLPGKWYLDPLIDCRQARPRAWIRADEPAQHRVNAIGLARSVGLVVVTICRGDENEFEALPSLAYQSLRGAIGSLPQYLESLTADDSGLDGR